MIEWYLQEACSTGRCGHKCQKGSKTAEEKEENQQKTTEAIKSDEQQKNAREDEMCKDLKRIIHTNTKMGKQMPTAIAALDKKIEELIQKIDGHIQKCASADAVDQTPADADFATAFSKQTLNLPYTQQTPLAATSATAVSEQGEHLPFPQQHKLFWAPEVQSPSPLLHALAHAESPHSDTPLPITEVNSKFTELPSSEIDRTKLKILQMFCGSIQLSEQSPHC